MRNADMSLMTNAVLELGTRLIQPEEEWKDKCVAFQELRQLISDFCMQQNTPTMVSKATKDVVSLFTPENMQALTQPFRVTVPDLRSTVVKEACTTLSLLTTTMGSVRCKILVRDVFPTLLEARGGSNKVNTAAVHNCIEAIVATVPSRFVLAPVLQMLDTSKNRDVRESCIYYIFLALESWKTAVLERFKIPLQPTIAASLSDASAKGREKARECYWKYISIWPDEVNRMNHLLPDGVKKNLKRPRKVAGLENSLQPPKRRHLATITNTVSSKSAAKNLLPGEDGVITNRSLGKLTQRLGTSLPTGERREFLPVSDKQTIAKTAPLLGKHGKNSPIASIQPSRIPSTPISSLKKPRGGNAPSKIPTPQPLPRSRTTPEAKSTTILEEKCAQFSRENAFLAKKLEIQAQDLQRLHDQIQMMSEDRQLKELRHKDAMSATMTAHAADRATQHKIQCKLTEKIASRNNELENMRSHNRLLHSSVTSPTQDQVTKQKSKLSSLTEQLQAATAKLEARNAEAGDEMSVLRSEKSVLEDRLSSQSAQLEELQTQQNAAVAALAEEKNLLASEVSASKSGHSEAVAQGNEKGLRRNDGLDDDHFFAGRIGILSVVTDDRKAKPVVSVRAFSLARTRDRFEIEDEERRNNEANLLKRRLRRQNHKRKA